MSDLPFPVNATDLQGIINQTQKLFEDLYQDRVGGAWLGDVFEIGGDDILSLNINEMGLSKSGSVLSLVCNPLGGIRATASGIGAYLKAGGGLSVDVGGIYSTEVAEASGYADDAAASALESAGYATASGVSAAAALAAQLGAEATEAAVAAFVGNCYYLKSPTGELTSISNPTDFGSLGSTTFSIENIAEFRYDLAEGSASLDLGSIA